MGSLSVRIIFCPQIDIFLLFFISILKVTERGFEIILILKGGYQKEVDFRQTLAPPPAQTPLIPQVELL